jgi:glycosidase
MRRISIVQFFLGIAIGFLSTVPAGAQWTTPTVDGSIGAGEYGTNNSLQNAGNTGQTWYMTWDASILYVGIVNANLSEGAVIYIAPNPQTPPTCCSDADGSLAGFNYDGTDFSSLPFRAKFVTYFKDGYREYRNSDGNGGWGSQTSFSGSYASNSGNQNTREIAIPWSTITGAGIPPSFVFFGYLTSSGGYVYGQAPPDNSPGGFIGTSATYTQYYAVLNTGNGTSTPPFSLEQPSGFSATDKAGFYHNTFDPFYRDQEGAVTENADVTLRFRTLHASGIWGVKVRAYLFDTGSGTTTGPVDTAMPFEQNITIGGTEYDVWKATLTMPSAATVYYYKFGINRDTTNGWYSDDYLDDNDNVHKDGTGAASDGEPFPSFQFTVYDPNFQTPAWLQNANVYHIMPDRFRNGEQTNDYCRAGSTTGCPTFYGADSSTVIHYDTWNTQMCDPRNSASACYNNFSQFYNGDIIGVQNELDYIQSLGFDTIYMNPVFQARSYHRYDTDNYLHIDPALGGDAAFSSLVTELNRRGIQVILDGVFNHASSDSLYFDRYHRYPTDGACESLASTWRSWFHFNDNNVPCNSADYPGWFGFDSLPTFDHTNSAVQDFFYRQPASVTAYWYGQGASGWRFDVADDGNFPHAWWADYRSFAKGYNSNGPLIGEIWPNASQWLAGDQMDSVMNYRFRKNITGFVRNAEWHDDNNNGTNDIPGLTPSQFDNAIRAVRDDYPPQATAAMLNLLDSHDVNRALYVMTEVGDTGLAQAKQRLELAALFQFTYIGAPMVYHGDEVAVNSPSQSSSANGPIGDPYTRPPYPWLDQAGDPTIYGPPDTAVQAYYTTLSHLRKQYPVLRNGSFVTLLTGDTQEPGTAPNTYAYARVLNDETAVIAINNSSASNAATIPVNGLLADGTQLQDAISGTDYSVSGGNIPITLAGLTGVVLLPSPVNLDLISPVASISTTPAANGNGWINGTPVSVTLGATDSGSGVEQLRYWINNGQVTVAAGSSAQTSANAEGSYAVGLRALDNSGNVSSPATLSFGIDVTPPAVAVTGVTTEAVYNLGSVPAAGCITTDPLSGVSAHAALNTIGGNGHGEGQFTATCSGGTDNAGNIAPPVSVTYDVVANVSSSVTVLTQYRSTKYTSATMTVRNTSLNNINVYGPLQVVLTQLTLGAALENATGNYLGNPYITIPGVTILPPGASASVQVQFNNPGNVKLNFTAVTYSGQFD